MTRSRASTTRGRGASSRTSPSTSRRRCGRAGRSLELGVGTGRIAIPIAAAGIDVVGVDSSAGMLEVAREQAALAGVERRPAAGRHARAAGRGAVCAGADPVPLAAAHGDGRRSPRGAARGREPRSRRAAASSSTSSPPARTTSPRPTAAGSSASRASGSGPTGTRTTRTLLLRVRGAEGEAEMSLAWLCVAEWRALLARGGLRRRRRLRLVRPPALARRRGLDLGLPRAAIQVRWQQQARPARHS